MLFTIGVVCTDDSQVQEIANLISNKVSITSPLQQRCMTGCVEFYFDTLILTISTVYKIRGYKFDICFYDEDIDNTLFQEIILPSCRGYAKPLKEFMWRIR